MAAAYPVAAALTITSSTISGNSGFIGGGIFFVAGTMNITSSTIAGNNVNGRGGGIYQVGGGALTIGNTIVASNTAAGAFPDIFRAVASQGNNLIGNTSGSGGFLPSDLLNVNPLLGPLQDNGGPTKTHALLVGSPALDAGNPTVVFNPAEFDQRRRAVCPRVRSADRHRRSSRLNSSSSIRTPMWSMATMRAVNFRSVRRFFGRMPSRAPARSRSPPA